jgi:peptidoglycan biosynthesis protein MviN/MurJ (putative lipid II flippase)
LNYRALLATLGRILFATAVMGSVIYMLTEKYNQFDGVSLGLQIVLLVGSILLAVGLYFISLKVMKSKELRELSDLVRKKRI